MSSITDALGLGSKPLSMEEMERKSEEYHNETRFSDDFVSEGEATYKQAVGNEDVDYYRKTDGDGRYLVRVGTLATMSIGTEAEDFVLKRLAVWSPHADGEVFNSNEVERGSIELIPIEDVPEQVLATAQRVMGGFGQIAEALMEYNYG